MVSEVRKVTNVLVTRESSEQNEAEVINMAHPISRGESETENADRCTSHKGIREGRTLSSI